MLNIIWYFTFSVSSPTFSVPLCSNNGSNLTILDDDFRKFPLCNAIISFLNCLSWTDLITSFYALFSSLRLNRLLLQSMISAPLHFFWLLCIESIFFYTTIKMHWFFWILTSWIFLLLNTQWYLPVGQLQ